MKESVTSFFFLGGIIFSITQSKIVGLVLIILTVSLWIKEK